MGKVVLVTGGVRSGKSSWALTEANRSSSPQKVFIATAVPMDDEMRVRIADHRRERGDAWQTMEVPDLLGEALDEGPPNATVIIDCCTVWLGNVWHQASADKRKMTAAVDRFLQSVESWQRRNNGVLYVISNEVGWGIVPCDAGVRLYRDTIGTMNQQIARLADEVYLCVAGIAVRIANKNEGVQQ